jgi:hypothetical protein
LKLVPSFDLSDVSEVSQECRDHSLLYLDALQKLELWALKSKNFLKLISMSYQNLVSLTVHDSTAKVPSGILNGNVNQFGDFDQCLSVVASNHSFQGKYCLASLQPKLSKPDQILEDYKKLIQSNYALRSEFEDVSFISFATKKISRIRNYFSARSHCIEIFLDFMGHLCALNLL